MLFRRTSGYLSKLRFLPRVTAACRQHLVTSSVDSSTVTTRPFDYLASCISTRKKWHADFLSGIVLLGQAAFILGRNSDSVLADDGSEELSGLRRIEDGSIVSNTHTVKWRIFTDNGRGLFLQDKLDEAEEFFILALQEAKEGFGERDAHVASSCNNLAEIYRVKKAFEKAEPLYLDAIKILEESFGPEDVRVGAALHNLGQFYLVQRKLEEARKCYERALKIKGRVLGYAHTDYAETMYHLGTVLHLQGKDKDAEALIQDSIRILEEGGLGESVTCIRRMRFLSKILLLKSNRLNDVENLQRKILHIFELSKGWDSLDTVIAAESLALTLQSLGNIVEARELMERCLSSKKTILGKDHIQVASDMLHLARIAMLHSNQLRKVNMTGAAAHLDKAKCYLDDSLRIARATLDHLNENQSKNVSGERGKDEHTALTILLQSLDAVGLLEVTKFELQPKEVDAFPVESELALRECISVFKQPGIWNMLNSLHIRAEYLSCLKHLMSIVSDSAESETQRSRATLQDLRDKVKHIEDELKAVGKHRR